MQGVYGAKKKKGSKNDQFLPIYCESESRFMKDVVKFD